jgi:hypothetical protein
MADREQPYDPYIPSGGSAPGGAGANGGNQRTAALQAVSPHDLQDFAECSRWNGIDLKKRNDAHLPPFS